MEFTIGSALGALAPAAFQITERLVITMGIVAVATLVGLLVFVWVAKRFLIICPPNMLLVLSGGKHKAKDVKAGKEAKEVGYRIVQGGRAWRTPVIETASFMDMTTIPIYVAVQNAYSKNSIPLEVHAIANVKLSGHEEVVMNAVERFLGRDRSEIQRVAKETLEGALRGVLARLTPEEVNEDRLKFAGEISEEVGEDLGKLGLQVDTLKIQSVSDEKEYLDLIGRVRIAEAIQRAEIAESNARNEANKEAAAVLERVGLGDRLHHLPAQVSGGQMQRIAIARALVNRPAIILADEPTGNLDLNTGQKIIDLLNALKTELGITVIAATHDMKMLSSSDRVVWIKDGAVDAIKTKAELDIQIGSIDGQTVA